MRTLKKALSLVLVLAMVFALAVPGFAADTTKKASDFKDYSKVTNKEAVDVLTAIGVINGNADGTFAPEGNFTRAEAATMITYLTLGKTVANALPVSATKFSDVPATHWAAKYVQYCADAGIVNGVGNGKFDPDAKLTATQWALMLLGALGYNAKNEGIGGAGWEIATTKLAMKAGVATASELTGTFNRDMAAKFALNTLKATTVEYKTNGTNITIGDTTISTGASAATAVETASDNGNIKNDGKVQFAEQHFDKLKLTATATTTDKFQRPSVTWSNGAVIGTYSKTADATYTTTVKTSAVYADLGLAAKVESSAVTVYVDGKEESALAKDVSKTGTDTFGGKGVLTEVYKTVNATTGAVTGLTVVEVNTYFGQVAGVTKATATTERTIKVDGMNFKTEGFAKDDYVLYTKANGEIQTVEAATVAATGKVTAVNNTKATFVVDGKTYEYSEKNATKSATLGATATLYLDNYGYVIKDTGAKTVTNYAIVTEVNNSYKTSIFGAATPMAKMVLADGTTVEVKYQVPTATAGTYTTLSLTAGATAIVTYTVSDDMYTLTQVTAPAAATTALALDSLTGAITANTATLKSGVYADSKTVFIVRSGAGTTANPYTYKSYTGIANVPSMTGVTATMAVKNYHAEIVFVSAGNETGTTATKAIYVTEIGAQQQIEYAADGKTQLTFWLQNAVVDGQVTTVKSTTKLNGLYSAMTTNSNGIVTNATAVTANKNDLSTATKIFYTNGVLSIGGAYKGFTSDAVCYTVDKTTGAITDTAINSLTDEDATFTGVYTVKDGIVTGLYLIQQ